MLIPSSLFFLFIALQVVHWIADYTPLCVYPYMIAAKKYGKPLWPIALHANWHGALMGIVATLFVPWSRLGMYSLVWLIVTTSRFLIDTGKGRMTFRFPILENPTKSPYWVLMGFDQLLHQIIIFAVVVLVASQMTIK